MNVLAFEKQVAVIGCLTEGLSIRSTERLTGVHRDTAMRLGARIGAGCAIIHDVMMHGLRPGQIQIDELWAYIGKKQRKVKPTDPPELGDRYTFIALDPLAKAIVSYAVGKRDGDTARTFLTDLRARTIGAPMMSSDAFTPYLNLVAEIFGEEVSYGQIVKRFVGEPHRDAARRYSPGIVVAVERTKLLGDPPEHLIGTSHIERLNLTVRMRQRRFTRLTNAYSKNVANHEAAVSLFVAHYNFVRVHESLRVTPAMELGLTGHVWSIGGLIKAAEAALNQPLGRPSGPFRVIDGGRA